MPRSLEGRPVSIGEPVAPALQGPESATENVRNALQLAHLLETELREPCTPAQRMEARLTMQAIQARLAAAIVQLEVPAARWDPPL